MKFLFFLTFIHFLRKEEELIILQNKIEELEEREQRLILFDCVEKLNYVNNFF
jgi:hypothetical protein